MKRKNSTKNSPGMIPALSAVFYDTEVHEYTPRWTWPQPGENEIINAWWFAGLLMPQGESQGYESSNHGSRQ
jgi:hypothetical protein